MNDLLKSLASDPGRLLTMFQEFERICHGSAQVSGEGPLRSEAQSSRQPDRFEVSGAVDARVSSRAKDDRSPAGTESASTGSSRLRELETQLKRCAKLGSVGERVMLSSFRLETHVASRDGSCTAEWSGDTVSLTRPGAESRTREVIAAARCDWNAVCFDSFVEDETQSFGAELEIAAAVVGKLARVRPAAAVYVEGQAIETAKPPRTVYQFQSRAVKMDWKEAAVEADELAFFLARALNRSSTESRDFAQICRTCEQEAYESCSRRAHASTLPIDLFLSTSSVKGDDWAWSRGTWREAFPALPDPISFGPGKFRSATIESTDGRSHELRLWPVRLNGRDLRKANSAQARTERLDSTSSSTEAPWWSELD